MFDTISVHTVKSPRDDQSFTKICAFVEKHREALKHAAELLAGSRGARLATRIAENLSDAPCLSRRCRRELEDLLDILALENVDDPESEEAACFAALDPASPVVEDICLLTDGLRDVLELSDKDHRQTSRARITA